MVRASESEFGTLAMKHFSDEVWADFVRGVAPTETAAGIKSHLAMGCADCSVTLDLWKRLHTAAADEAKYSAPEELVRRLKLEFTSEHSSPVAKVAPAALVFDSFLRPLPAGVRSGASAARQLVYESEGLTVDLRVEKEPQSTKFSAIGQVMDKWTPPSTLSSGTVILWTAQGFPVFETKPNEHGEFQIEFGAQDQLHLSVAMPGRNPMRITLPELEQGSSAAGKVT
jgi:hypothetical protein